MKKCLKCGQSYSDDTLNFCLSDGELLVDPVGWDPPPTRFADDSPPTLLLNQPRVTNPIDWPQSSPVGWQQPQHPVPVTNQYPAASYAVASNKTLPTISLVLGIISLVLVCCAGGIWLGLPAAIVGFIAMRNTENDPARYGGRAMAIGGMVLGIITFIMSLLFLIFGQLS